MLNLNCLALGKPTECSRAYSNSYYSGPALSLCTERRVELASRVRVHDLLHQLHLEKNHETVTPRLTF